MTAPDTLVAAFVDASAAVRAAVSRIDGWERRARTARPGQYALDLVADAAACAVLEKLSVRVVSEESGVHDGDRAITVVLDPVDGSTNCARGIAYWSTSICAVDGDGPLAALVENHATGQRTIAIRGGGALRDGAPLVASTVVRLEDAVVGLGGYPETARTWKQSRALGCCSLHLCDVAAGGLDGYLDPAPSHAPWDYLGGMLACTEAGATIFDVRGEALVTDALDARRQLIAAGTVDLANELARGLV
jgi:fructose-1,6-bisphosphatase/inositol monophosphatase family enzyme